MAYKLVCEFYTPAPIRALTQEAGFVFTGAEDACVRKFSVGAATGEVEATAVVIQHDHWVTALTYLAPGNAVFPDGALLTGCRDGVVRIYTSEGALLKELRGHEAGVISFSWAGALLVSGSWDGTARVWDLSTGMEVKKLPGHENGVSVLGLSQNVVATASTGEKVGDRPANFKLRMWDVATGDKTLELEDHGGSIRCLTALGAVGFVSCSNDGSAKIRAPDGSDSGTVMHDPQDDGSLPIVLTCAGLPLQGETVFATAAEDGSCFVWDGLNRAAALPHPTTVWCICPLSNGDFATGSEDGILRVFSKDPARQAAADADTKSDKLGADVEAVRASRRARAAPSAAEVGKYPKWEEAAGSAGSKDGEVKVFNKGGVAIAAQWEGVSACWIEVGEVTGQDGGSKSEINGVAYDYVLPVEMETSAMGVVSYQLGYNTGENPFIAAQRFIDAYSFEQYHLQQIADFITSNTGAAAQAPTFDLSQGTGNGSGSQPMDLVGATPGSSSAPAPVPAPGSIFTFFPVTYQITFDDVPAALLTKVLPKYLEMNAGLSVAEQDAVTCLATTLKDTSHYHSTSVSNYEALALTSLLPGLPVDGLYPSFDMTRMAMRHPEGSAALVNSGALVVALDKLQSVLSAGPACPTPTALTGLRMLCNVTKDTDARTKVLQGQGLLDGLLAVAVAQTASGHKLVRGALAALLANVGSVGSSVNSTSLSVVCEAAMALALGETDSTDVILRSCLALGSAAKGAASADRRAMADKLEGVRLKWADRLDTSAACVEETVRLLRRD